MAYRNDHNNQSCSRDRDRDLGKQSDNNPHYSIAIDSSAFLESQNDIKMNELSKKVSLLRGITTDIYNDVNNQNDLLDSADRSTFSRVESLLNSSQRNLKHTMSRRNSRFFILVLLAILFFYFSLSFIFRLVF